MMVRVFSIAVVVALTASGCSPATPPARPTASASIAATPRDPQAFDSTLLTALERNACLDRLPGPTSTKPKDAVALYLYFTCSNETQPANLSRARFVNAESGDIEAVLRQLLAGPTDEEKQAGFFSTFNEKTAGLGFETLLKDRFLVIDFDAAALKIPRLFVSNEDAAQIMATAGQFDSVRWVTIRIAGRPMCESQSKC